MCVYGVVWWEGGCGLDDIVFSFYVVSSSCQVRSGRNLTTCILVFGVVFCNEGFGEDDEGGDD